MTAEYIDREAAKYVLRERYRIRTHFHDMESAGQLKCAELEIGDIPAADVRPVVRGKWIPHYEDFDDYDGGVEKRQWGFECSICGRWEENAEPFCNCGADMREGS